MDELILLDLTELLRQPLRTGIQRVTYEVIRHWAGDCALFPVRLGDDGQLYRIPGQPFRLLQQFFGDCSQSASQAKEELQSIGARVPQPRDKVVPTRFRALLNLELFFCNVRIAFYRKLLTAGWGDHLYFLVYDLLPWLQPQWFHPGASRATIEYLRLLREIPHLAFISELTRRDFVTRFLRGSERADWPALALGSDGLGSASAEFLPHSRRFTVVGTLEPRKNVRAVLEAFDQLWHAGVDVELTMVGRVERLEKTTWELFDRLRSSNRFHWCEQPDDAELRRYIRSSRATLFPSLAEGYGLPPLESLALGVPVIVSSHIPSLEMIETAGQIRLLNSSAADIARAVLLMLNDDTARRKTEEIACLRLPRWSDLGDAISGWVERRKIPEASPEDRLRLAHSGN